MSDIKDTKPEIKATPVISPQNADRMRDFSPRPVVPRHSLANAIEIGEKESDIIVPALDDSQPTVYSEGPFDIVVREYGYEIEGDDTLIQFPKTWAANLSVALHNVPDIANSINNYHALGQTAYSITLEGRDVLPQELFKKNNGSLISNLKGERTWGKQTDVNPIDFSDVRSFNVANAVFGVASAVTSTYYLKTINDSLTEIKGAVQSIYDFLTQNEQSKIEVDIEILEDIKNSLPAIANNYDLKEDAINKLSNINREARATLRSYEKRIKNTSELYKEGNRRVKRKAYRDLQIQFYYYTICLGNYALSEMLITQIADAFDDENLERISNRISKQQEIYKELYKVIDETVELGMPNIFAISTSLASWLMEEKLSIDNRFSRKVTEIACEQIDAYNEKETKLKEAVLYCDENILDPVMESISLAKYMNRDKIQIVASEDDYYIQSDVRYIE